MNSQFRDGFGWDQNGSNSYPLLDARTGILCALSQAGRFEVVEVFNSVGFFVKQILQELRFTGSVESHELYDFVLNYLQRGKQLHGCMNCRYRPQGSRCKATESQRSESERFQVRGCLWVQVLK